MVYWSTNYQGFGLEATPNLGTNATWSTVTGPYYINGGNFEYHESQSALLTEKYFRLKYPTVIMFSLLPP